MFLGTIWVWSTCVCGVVRCCIEISQCFAFGEIERLDGLRILVDSNEVRFQECCVGGVIGAGYCVWF